jgi:hypothetical protein
VGAVIKQLINAQTASTAELFFPAIGFYAESSNFNGLTTEYAAFFGCFISHQAVSGAIN